MTPTPAPARRPRQHRAQPYELRRLDYLKRTGRHEDEQDQLRDRISQLRAYGAIDKEARRYASTS